MKNILIVLVTFFTWFSYGQEKQLNGTVTDFETGVPIPGANVSVHGTTKGVVTDFDGKFNRYGSLLIKLKVLLHSSLRFFQTLNLI
ncbi:MULTISPECIES: carboxypeptidase-like regulatory domain-containing protein [Galbibacter]|uniref:Uncharacterized protein n=1 Tax=Galbibacter orientalis DSM 19592 TaxID=926559 RepID=I3C4U5_9FLAO|nr:carboxypeptidase-like regulatory domain-containing protein [Galbibacter orientalis]EIJ38638.1 hypothetical protein JoomaDRAFT_1626 [Galbibacter orientalis DSM 19592]